MTSNVKCAVCGELMENFKLVQLTVKCLSSLMNASKEKNDGKHEEWQHTCLSQLAVHESCRKTYIRHKKKYLLKKNSLLRYRYADLRI